MFFTTGELGVEFCMPIFYWNFQCGYYSNEEWSSQLWSQFLQLRKEAWKKIQDFNGAWTRDLAIPVRRSNQLSYRYEATDVGSRSILGSYVPVKDITTTVVIIIIYKVDWPKKPSIQFGLHFEIDQHIWYSHSQSHLWSAICFKIMTQYKCSFLPRILAIFSALWVFFPSMCPISLRSCIRSTQTYAKQTRIIFIYVHNTSPYISFTNKHVYMGSWQVVV